MNTFVWYAFWLLLAAVAAALILVLGMLLYAEWRGRQLARRYQERYLFAKAKAMLHEGFTPWQVERELRARRGLVCEALAAVARESVRSGAKRRHQQ